MYDIGIADPNKPNQQITGIPDMETAIRVAKVYEEQGIPTLIFKGWDTYTHDGRYLGNLKQLEETMTPEELRYNASIMLAAADGKPVEQRSIYDNFWIRKQGGAFNFDHYRYRIAPEPPKEVWTCFWKEGSAAYCFNSLKEAESWYKTNNLGNCWYLPPVLMREVREKE